MADGETCAKPSNDLFFAGSDDEDEDVNMQAPPSELPQTPPSGPLNRNKLFLSDSEDECISDGAGALFSTPKKRQIVSQDNPDSDIEIPMLEEQPRASSVSSNASDCISVSSSSPPPGGRPKAARPPAKKRRLSPPSAPSSTFSSAYLGSLLVGDAWSTVTGKGYVKIHDEIRIQRDKQDESGVGFRNPSRKKDVGKKKQMSIATMLTSQSAKSSKKKADSIVRLTNARGFGAIQRLLSNRLKLTTHLQEFGRLPQDVALWVSKLLDMGVSTINLHLSSLHGLLGIVEFRGSTMVDCPETLRSGTNLIVSLSIYILPSAFKPVRNSLTDKDSQVMFNEGQETLDERILRERKSSLLKLFEKLELKPQAGADVVRRKVDEQLHEEALKRMAKHSANNSKKVKEIVGDGEEIEVEDGEDLSKNELDMIYQR